MEMGYPENEPDAIRPEQLAVEAVKDLRLSYGDVVSRDWLLDVMGLAEPEGPVTVREVKQWELKVLPHTQAFKELMLTECNMMLWSTHDGAWRIVKPSEQTTLAWKAFTDKLRKEFKRLALRLLHVDVRRLSDAERRANTDARAKAQTLCSMVSNALERKQRLTRALNGEVA